MNRVSIIQQIIDRISARTYLEIGVQDGFCFLQLRAPRKIAVDPRILIPRRLKVKCCFRNPTNVFNRYHQMPSDEFFSSRGDSLKKSGLDVVFVDGLHTYEQSLADVRNSLKFLNEGGVILMHDCLPPSFAAAYPALSYQDAERAQPPGWAGEWCGDVWKTIVHLRSMEADLRIFVLDCDYGVGIIIRGKPETVLNYRPSEIAGLTYDDFAPQKVELLNLKPPGYLETFLKELA